MSISRVSLKSPFDAVTRYLEGVRPTWMYSPFFLVLVSSVRLVFRLNNAILAPSTGLPWASTTLPLICPVWAKTGDATIARPMAMALIVSVRRMLALVMRDSSIRKGDRDLSGPPPLFYTGRRSNIGDQVLAYGPAAGRARVDGPPRRHRLRPEPRRTRRAVPGVERLDRGGGGIAQQDRRAPRRQCDHGALKGLLLDGVETAGRVRREARRAAEGRIRRVQIDEVVLPAVGERGF